MATRRMLGRSQIDASDALHEYSCSPCSEEGKNSEALYHCSICQAFYCQICVDFHNKFTKNHDVTDKTSDTFGQKVGKSATQFSDDLPTDVCEEHHGEVVKMFCGHHDLVCCTVCVAVKHRSCKGVEYIPNIARGFLKSQRKEGIKTSLQSVKADLETLKSKVENNLKRLDKQRDGIIDGIQEFKKRIIARVEELERKSLIEVKSKHKELADNINTYNKKIDDLLKLIDTRLHKLAHSKKGNEAQTFVDVKNGERELSKGVNLAKQTTLRDAKLIAFEKNADIEEYLKRAQSLGSLKGSVNIVCPVETRITSAFINYETVDIVCPVKTRITIAFISELQSQLKSYGIQSECTKISEIVAGRYKIVLCEHNNVNEAMEITKGIQDGKIILMIFREEHQIYHNIYLPLRTLHLKATFTVLYTKSKNGKYIAFANESNKLKYESISKIVTDHK